MYYKDMEVWKEAINLSIDIYNLTLKYPEEEKYGLISQMRRSVVSVASNVAEGCARKSNKDTLRFIDIAIGSLAELDTQIIISSKLTYIAETIEDVNTKIEKLFALLRGLRKHLEDRIKE